MFKKNNNYLESTLILLVDISNLISFKKNTCEIQRNYKKRRKKKEKN